MNMLTALKWKASVWNRHRKLNYILSFIHPDDHIVDVGVYPIQKPPVDGTNYLEEYFRKTGRAMDALALHGKDYTYFQNRYKNCRLHLFDGEHFPDFPKRFDVALSNAVLEHVGPRETQVAWLKSLSAICDMLIITTPNRYFPVESHTNCFLLHIVSASVKEKLRQKGLFLLSKKEFLSLLQEADYKVLEFRQNRMMFLPMDFVAVCIANRSN